MVRVVERMEPEKVVSVVVRTLWHWVKRPERTLGAAKAPSTLSAPVYPSEPSPPSHPT